MKKIFALAVLFAAVCMVSCGDCKKKAENAEAAATECCAECEQAECAAECAGECAKAECAEGECCGDCQK